MKTKVAAEIITNTCLTLGGAALAYAPVVWTAQPSGWISLVMGVALIAAGVAAKVVRP